MIFTGIESTERGKKNLIDCESCGYLTAIYGEIENLPGMACKKCGCSSEKKEN